MKLFEVEDNDLKINPYAFGLKPYKALITRNKDRGKAELLYIWYMVDSESDFYNIPDDNVRSEEVIKIMTGLPKDWKPDELVQEALNYYRTTTETVSEKVLKNTIALLERINDFVTTINPAETYTDKYGNIKFLHDFKKVMGAAKELPPLIETLKKIKDSVAKEKDDIKVRGQKLKSALEDE